MNESEKALGEAKDVENHTEVSAVSVENHEKILNEKNTSNNNKSISSIFSKEDIFKLEHQLGEVGKTLYRELSEKLSEGFMDSSFDYAEPMNSNDFSIIDENETNEVNSTNSIQPFDLIDGKTKNHQKKLEQLYLKGSALREKRNYKEAKICFTEYLNLAKKVESFENIIQGLIYCAEIAYYLDNHIESMNQFIESITLTFNNIGHLEYTDHIEKNNKNSEVEENESIIFLSEWISRAFIGISDIYTYFKSYDNALIIKKQALIYAKINNKKEIKANTLLHMLPTLFQLSQYKLAHKITKEVISLLKEGERDDLLAEAYAYQGSLFLKENDYAQALEKASKANELSELVKNTRLISLSLSLLGQIHSVTNNLECAVEYLEKAFETVKKTYSKDLEKEIKTYLMRAYDKKGMHKEILEMIKESHNTLDVNYKDLNVHIKEQIDEQLTNMDLMLDMLTVVKENEHHQNRVSLLEIENKLDGLTGIHNRRALEAKLVNSIQENEVCSLILMDIDYFKKVNDNFGHIVGDKVLKEMGLILSMICRKEDFLARYGGEELCVVVNNKDKSIGIKTAERIRIAVEEYNWESIAPNLKVTVSLGVYLNDGYYKSSEDWVSATDSLLYRAKKLGRNKVCYDGEVE